MRDDSPDTWHGHRYSTDFYDFEYGRQALLASGSVPFLAHPIDGDLWSSLVRLDDGGPVEDWDGIPANSIVTRKPRWANWIALATFLLLALLPLRWVWLQQSANPARSTEDAA